MATSWITPRKLDYYPWRCALLIIYLFIQYEWTSSGPGNMLSRESAATTTQKNVSKSQLILLYIVLVWLCSHNKRSLSHYHVNIRSSLPEPRWHSAGTNAWISQDLCLRLGDAGFPLTLLSWYQCATMGHRFVACVGVLLKFFSLAATCPTDHWLSGYFADNNCVWPNEYFVDIHHGVSII